MLRIRFTAALIAIALILCLRAPGIDVSPSGSVTIGVFGLFHPRELTVSVAGPAAIVIRTGAHEIILERSSGTATARISIVADGILVATSSHEIRAKNISVTSRTGEPASFYLSVPHRIRRRYRGILQITAAGRTLTPVVAMSLEDAVASIVAAETTPDTPIEAMKAQAVAARSYLVAARGRHIGFDFCDTTHCQFLRELPSPDSNAAKAVSATRGLVLAYRSEPFAAMYTRSCGGRTHTPSEIGMPAGNYPYYPVDCPHCRSHAIRWTRRLSKQEAQGLRSLDEASRLVVIRRLGSAAVPSDDFVMTSQGDEVLLQGTGEGHGIGLCQAGAKAMAMAGAEYHDILTTYYPNATIESLP